MSKKDRQYNGQEEKVQNDRQNTTQNLTRV